MNDQQHITLTTVDYETIPENDSINFFDDDFKNLMEIIIAEYIGSIPKNSFVDLVFSF
jgi:hypothetical protein